ncbi:MAG: hypothetical protein MJH09_06785 [Cetobacterium sp.]|nr:hypothetical protein [Cetobacterium sp.]
MKCNLFQTLIFEDTKDTLSYFKVIDSDVIPQFNEEIMEFTEEHTEIYKVSNIIYNLDDKKLDFVNIFLQELYFETSSPREKLERFFENTNWTRNVKN